MARSRVPVSHLTVIGLRNSVMELLDSPTPTEAEAKPTVLGYSRFDVGLNNQKLALFGLFCRAREKRLPVILPDFCVFNPATGHHTGVALNDVYPIEGLYRFARAFGVTILDAAPIDTITAWDCFIAGSSHVAAEGLRGLQSLTIWRHSSFAG